MRAVAIALSFLLLSACARPGDQIQMTEADLTEAPAADEVGAALETSAVADPAPVRDIRTATFALG